MNAKKILLSLSASPVLFATFFLTSPIAVFAQDSSGCTVPKNIGELFTFAICTLTKFVVPFLFALALIMFLTGVIKYVKNGDNEESREAGRGMMLFGIIALFVMTSVWGLVKILYSSFFTTTFEMPSLPPQATTPFK
jgi:hypothetical protein